MEFGNEKGILTRQSKMLVLVAAYSLSSAPSPVHLPHLTNQDPRYGNLSLPSSPVSTTSSNCYADSCQWRSSFLGKGVPSRICVLWGWMIANLSTTVLIGSPVHAQHLHPRQLPSFRLFSGIKPFGCQEFCVVYKDWGPTTSFWGQCHRYDLCREEVQDYRLHVWFDPLTCRHIWDTPKAKSQKYFHHSPVLNAIMTCWQTLFQLLAYQ